MARTSVLAELVDVDEEGDKEKTPSKKATENTEIFDLEPSHTLDRPRVRRIKEPFNDAELDKMVELGINFIDTAELYPVAFNYGQTTELWIGNWLRQRVKRLYAPPVATITPAAKADMMPALLAAALCWAAFRVPANASTRATLTFWQCPVTTATRQGAHDGCESAVGVA